MMKKALVIGILAVLLVCCVQAAALTVGTEIKAEAVTDFYYTYSWVGFNAEYQRYRFYTGEGKYFFFYETRGTEDDYGWNTEDDILSAGTKELTEDEWAEFFALLEGGTVTGRSEEVTDGNSGPWMYLYWEGDESVYQEYTFASPAAQFAFKAFCEELAAEPLTTAGLLSCEYSVFGGMENENTVYTVARTGEFRWDIRLSAEIGGEKEEKLLPRDTLDDLADFAAGYHPEKWDFLPDREYYALDAPVRRIVLTYEDGTEYTVTNDKETDGPLFGEMESFLRSYLAEDAQTFELSFESFEGGGPEYRAVLSAPEIVRVEEYRGYNEAYDVIPPGAGYQVQMIFHGRIPGRTELTIEESGPLAPAEDVLRTVYALEVDNDYNVTLAEAGD